MRTAPPSVTGVAVGEDGNVAVASIVGDAVAVAGTAVAVAEGVSEAKEATDCWVGDAVCVAWLLPKGSAPLKNKANPPAAITSVARAPIQSVRLGAFAAGTVASGGSETGARMVSIASSPRSAWRNSATLGKR